MTKAPLPTQIQKGKVTTQKRHQILVYTKVADRLKTVSWNGYSYPSWCVKASMHSFKRFTSRLLKLSFSLCMHL